MWSASRCEHMNVSMWVLMPIALSKYARSEEHTSELQSQSNLVCRLLLEKKKTRETFTDEECETLLRGFLSPRMFERGLICRSDDRGDPVVQISPPLVADQHEFEQIAGILGDVLQEAWERVSS